MNRPDLRFLFIHLVLLVVDDGLILLFLLEKSYGDFILYVGFF